jgi:cellulose synthase/poly-beta-1,6-N-acetylglucosamine synthase-like glycosyltransferase
MVRPARLSLILMTLSLLLAWLLTDIVATYGVLHHRRAFVAPPALVETPRAAVLVAIKGVTPLTPLFLDALGSQLYSGYRLIFALESEADQAFALVTNMQRQWAGRLEIDIVIAGCSTCRAQKVHNLLEALRGLRVEDRVVVFADADIVPHATWLSQLVRPVAVQETAASCGYRWQLPQDRRFPSLAVAAIDISIATAARSRHWNLCWGGSVAIDRVALDQIDLPTVWDRAASDDLTLSAALRARGLRMYVPPHVLVPSPVSHDFDSLFRFAHRQYLLVRIYAFRHWLLCAWLVCVPTFAVSMAVRALWCGSRWPLGFILASGVLLQLRLSARRRIAHQVLQPAQIDIAHTTLGFARWAWPLIHLTHLAAFITSAVGYRFTWAGIHYRLRGKAVSVEGRTQEPR